MGGVSCCVEREPLVHRAPRVGTRGKVRSGQRRGSHMQGRIERLEQRRMLSAGDLDSSFGSGGIATLDLGGDAETVAQLLPAPNGKLLAFGRADTGNRLVIARFNSDGTLDSSFATNGKSETTVIVPNM